MEVLFIIGNGFEKGEIIKDLLDVEKNPRRPSFFFSQKNLEFLISFK